MTKRCCAKNRNDERCGAWAVTGKRECALHSDPDLAAKMGARNRRRSISLSEAMPEPGEAPRTAAQVRDLLAETLAQVKRQTMDTKTANALAYVAASLLRAIEVSDLESRLVALSAQMGVENGNS